MAFGFPQVYHFCTKFGQMFDEQHMYIHNSLFLSTVRISDMQEDWRTPSTLCDVRNKDKQACKRNRQSSPWPTLRKRIKELGKRLGRCLLSQVLGAVQCSTRTNYMPTIIMCVQSLVKCCFLVCLSMCVFHFSLFVETFVDLNLA